MPANTVPPEGSPNASRRFSCWPDSRPRLDLFSRQVMCAAYEGFVIGSATYSALWRKDATAFVMSNRDLLAHRPVWLFSTGPLGTDVTDANGVDLRTAAEPKQIAGLRESIHPRDHQVFFGALDPGRLTFAEKTLRKLPAARAMMPDGDFRDWTEIEDWARGVAEELTQRDAEADERDLR